MDQILHADNAHLAELALDDVIGGDGGTVTIDLTNFFIYTEFVMSFVTGK